MIFKKRVKIILILLSICLFARCEGFVDYSGVVYDVASEVPLKDVQCIIVKYKDRGHYSVSDSLGIYSVGTPLVGCVPDCGDYNVEFSKPGYKTQIVHAPIDVFLEKE